MNPEQIGSFRILERIGEGGMGEVYRAMDTMLEREVALKTLRPDIAARADLVERFRVEAIALAKLHHPHIAAVYSFFRDHDQYHMAMQFIQGVTLEDLLQRQGRLPWPQAARIAADILLALAHAHEQGVIHRDLKPGNLMLEPSGHVVVMDFGIARVLARRSQTECGKIIGTMDYLAPEVIRGSPAADARMDLYALGVVLYEMVTGRAPFQADTEYGLMRAHLEQAPPPPTLWCPDLPENAQTLILRALSKYPEDRYADAREFLAALERAAGLGERTLQDMAPVRAMPGAGSGWAHRWHDFAQTLRAQVRRRAGPLEAPTPRSRAAWQDWILANPGLAIGAAGMVVSAGIVLSSLLPVGSDNQPITKPSQPVSAPAPSPPSIPRPPPVPPAPPPDAGVITIEPAPDRP